MASTLIIENGTNVSGADSYLSASDATVYCANYRLTSWSSQTDAQKDVLLRKATQYIDQYYLRRWKGQRTYNSQPLQWPRQYVLQYEPEPPVDDYNSFAAGIPVYNYIDKNTIPTELKNAVAEAAYKFIAQDMTEDQGRKTTSESVGSLSVTYAASAKEKTIFTRVEQLLTSLLLPTGQTKIYRS